MTYARRVTTLAAVLFFALPSLAFAMEAADQTAAAARVAVDAIALAVAIALLLDVLALRRVAEGSLFGDNLILVLVAVICLSTSVLASWVQNFMPGFGVEQVTLTRDLLVLASMVTLGVYFFRVRRALLKFVRGYPGVDATEERTLAEANTDPDATESGPRA